MSTLDTLTVRFEADAKALFDSLDTVSDRLNALRAGSTNVLPAMGDIQMQLTVTADEAISRALANAGSMLSAAVLSHEEQFASALSASQQAMAAALQSAAQQLASSIQITVPVAINGQQVATATEKLKDKLALQSGSLKL